MLTGGYKDLAIESSRLIHLGDRAGAAETINRCLGLGVKGDFDRPDKHMPVIQTFLHYMLNENGMEEAAAMLWTPTQFTSEPQYTKDLWKLFDETNAGLIMGAASCSKSYGIGVRLFLEWIRDPEYTTIKVIGPSEEHLEQNLFSHLVSLHNSATLPMPGEVGELFIGLDRRDMVSSIKGVIIPVGKVKKAGRLQGAKRKPRIKPHPIFGPLSRMFVFIDEIENVPGGLWSDIDNVFSNIGDDVHGLKIFGAYNPTNMSDEVGKRAEPLFGWENFDPDKHFRWKSKRGWEVLRLDGEKSENVVQGKVIFPGLQTRAGLEQIARNAGGRNSPGYFSMGRGAYPPQGIELTVIPPAMFYKMRGEFIWYEAPQPTSGCDVALEGGDAASYSLGRCGWATGMKLPPSIDFPNGRTVMFKSPKGRVVPRWGVQLDQQFSLEKGDTPHMKNGVLNVTKRAGVKPEYFAIDRTGVGAGVADLIKDEWSRAIHDINYSQAPSTDKIMTEDSMTCDQEYDRICSELWFMTRAYAEFGYLLIAPSVDIAELSQQVTQRRYRAAGKTKKVEAKRDYMSRGYKSPNEADSLTLMIYAARKGSGITPSMTGESVRGPDNDGGLDDDWWTSRYPGGVIIDPTNRADVLDESASEDHFLST
jgi:hypothetical protein